MEIPFTQFLLPNGKQIPVTFECPYGFEERVKKLLEGGASFEIEILQTGLVSLTVEFEKPDGEIETLGHEISSNDLQIDSAVAKLISSSFISFKEIEANELGRGI